MTKKTYNTLTLTSPIERVLLLSLNRIEVSNAFNTEMAAELTDVFQERCLDPESYSVVVLTGAGDKAFCAGGDLKERHGMSDDAWFAQHRVYEAMVRSILQCPVPLIAAVNGAAFGGGCELVAACDFAYASKHARFAQTETQLGIMPGAGGTQCLPKAVGVRRAQELILSGKVFTAAEAYQWGLVNEVFEADQLLPESLKMAATIAANAPLAVRQAKQAVQRSTDLSTADGLAFEIEAYNRLVSSDDRREGIASFNEKREPRFTGR